MTRQTTVSVALAASLAALAASLLAGPGRAAHPRYSIAYLTYVNMAKGSRAAAEKLGVRIVHGSCGTCSPRAVAKLYESMIARHVDAVVSDGFDPALKPTLTKVRKAGILLVSSGDDIAATRDLWVSQSDPVAYAHALADALASQVGGKGEYAVLEQRDEYPVADRWGTIAQTYVARAYPSMTLDGVVRGTGAGDEAEVDSVKSFMAAHPHLAGLLAVTPTEGYMAAEAITQAGRIGQIFSAGNGGSSLADPQLQRYVRSGAAQLVYGSDPVKLGYLTVWAVHYLLTGHRFRAGAYQVGAPVGLVWYYPERRELRLGQPLTVTEQNIDQFAGTF